MSVETRCVHCGKPLIDAEHAKKHVVSQCEKSPSKKLADALERLAAHPCAHAPACGHGRFSECRNALVAAIQKESAVALRAVGRIP